MSLGTTLRQAREAKGQSVSQVAEATRMMVQIVEDLEREDFRRIAAPIYGRGFIKLYAEHLGLDAEALIREFMEIYTGSRPPQVARRAAEAAPAAAAEVEPAEEAPAAVAAEQPAAVPEPSASPAPERVAAQPAAAAAEPDLFTLAADRSEAARVVADPARPVEATPPRVRVAASARAEVRPQAGEAPRRREPLQAPADAPAGAAAAGSRSLSWSPALIGIGAGVVILLLFVVTLALSHRHGRGRHAAGAPVRVERVLLPAAPYFD